MTFLTFLALFPADRNDSRVLNLKRRRWRKGCRDFFGVNVLTLVYLLIFHTPIGSRLMAQDAYWIGAMEEFMTAPVFIICAAARSRCFQKIMESFVASAEESDFTKTTGLVLVLIVANVWLLAVLARASF